MCNNITPSQASCEHTTYWPYINNWFKYCQDNSFQQIHVCINIYWNPFGFLHDTLYFRLTGVNSDGDNDII